MAKRRDKSLLDYMVLDRKAERKQQATIKSDGGGKGDNIQKLVWERQKRIRRGEVNHYTSWFVRMDDAVIKDGYLLSYYYDPDRNKALLAFYTPSDGKLHYWYDKTEHKPYFIVRETPEEAEKLIPPTHRERFVTAERIYRMNPLKMKKESYTRIVVKDPLAVRDLRDRFSASWESNIKYHQNFVYDRALVPGMRYNVRGRELSLKKASVSEDLSRRIGEITDDKDTALAVLPYFEEQAPTPPMAAFDIEVYSPFESRVPDVKTASYPVLAVTIIGTDGLKKTLVLDYPLASKSRLNSTIKHEVIVFDSERQLLMEAFRILVRYPIVLSYNGDGFDMPYLRKRALNLGFREEEIPIQNAQDYYTMKTGIHIDLYSLYENRALKTYAFKGSYRENTLDSVAENILGVGKVRIEESPARLGVKKLVEYNFRDSYLTLELFRWKNFLPWKLLVLLSRLTKTGIEMLSRTQISNWIRNMLYWEHRYRRYLIPRKEDILAAKSDIRSKAIIKGKKYAGAIVLEPPVGIFFNVVVLDFASLYPSIIKVWNLSYETVNPEYPCRDLREVPGVGHKVCLDRKGMISSIIGVLRDLRVRVYKSLSKKKDLPNDRREWYGAVQSAMKVLLNASYGVFGSENFALYAPPVAESVTAIGRYVIQKTVEQASSMGLKVLYGDTDSMFIWSPSEESINKLIKIIEREYNLDLEVDKIFKYIAFSGLKKNYLGVTPEGEVEIKGMLGKKRNQPEFLKKAFREVIEQLKNVNKPSDFLEHREIIKEEIKKIYRKLRNKGYMLDELAFNVMLNKPVKDYVKTTPQHVKAAVLLEPFGKKLSRGDIISYVKVKNREGVKPVQLAKLNEIDIDKYTEALKSTFDQILQSINIDWEEIAGMARLESFFS